MKYLFFIILTLSTLYSERNIIKDNYEYSYDIVISPYTGRIWLDRNLGAKRVCTSIDDKLCYGSYFQWGRKSDGHEIKSSKITKVIAISPRVSHGKFISPKNLNESMGEGWLKNDKTGLWKNLWKGEYSINNPCPVHFRVPTSSELIGEIPNKSKGALIDAYNSFLKIPHSSLRYASGEMDSWKWANLWSSNYEYYPQQLMIMENQSRIKSYRATAGIPIRCIKD